MTRSEKKIRVALSVGLFAVCLQIVGRLIIGDAADLRVAAVGLFIALLGVAILISSIRAIAIAKGRNPGWSFLALFSVIGLIIVVSLRSLRGRGN